MARLLPAGERTRAQHASFTLSEQLIHEIRQADTVLLGLPLYNYGPPSTVKAWVDHLVAPGLSIGEDGTGLLGDTDFLVLESRGGGYGSGTPREGWDHAEAWLPHAVSHTGLQPRFIVVELTMAESNPVMATLTAGRMRLSMFCPGISSSSTETRHCAPAPAIWCSSRAETDMASPIWAPCRQPC